jgi:peptide/nickel transport system substrate-binding protein
MSSSGDIDKLRRRLLQAVGASGVGVALAGCQGQTGDSTETTTGDGDGSDTATETPFQAKGPGDEEFIAGTTSGAQSLNPINISDEATTNRLDLFYDVGGVATQDGEPPAPLEFEPRLLTGWNQSDDQQTVTYTVREGVQWGADYGELTADDYIEFVNTIVYGDFDKEQNPVGYTQTGSYILGGERIEFERLGKYEFRANLPQPRPYWLAEDPLRTAWILPQGLIEKYKPVQFRQVNDNEATVVTQIGQDEAIVEADLVGQTGPFNFESWEQGQKLVVTANDDYYLGGTDVRDGAFEGSPNLSSYTYQVFDEQSTGYSAIRAGDITSIGVEGRKVEENDTEDTRIYNSKFGTGVFYLNLNHRINGWAPIRESTEVRQAFAHLIDKNTLIDQIFEGYANPAATFHPEWGPFYPDELPTFEPSVEQARQKIASGTGSDYTYNGQDQLIGPDGEQVELTMVIDNTSQTGEIVGNYIDQRLQQVGISTSIEGNSFGQILQTYLFNSVSNNPNYDGEPDYSAGNYNGGPPDQAISSQPWDILYGVGFSAAPYSPWQVINLVFAEQAQFNYLGYTTDEIDIAGRVTDAATASSTEETQRILGELFAFLAEEQPVTWLFNDNTLAVYRESVDNIPEPVNFFTAPNSRLLELKTQQ